MAALTKANSLKNAKPRLDSPSSSSSSLKDKKKFLHHNAASSSLSSSKLKSEPSASRSLPPNKPTRNPSSNSKSSEAKDKTSSNSTKRVTQSATVKPRAQKKVYTLPGQKYDPPEEREPLRIFYESLSKQIPQSEMAEFWMMEHGLLSPERARKAYERKQKRQHEIRTGTPMKPIKIERPESSQKQHTAKNGDLKPKKKINYSDDDDDFIIKHKKARV